MADKVKDDTEVDDRGMIRVLVYGTLKEGHANHRLIKAAGGQFLGYDSLSGPFRMVDMTGFPGVVMEEADDDEEIKTSTIYGELWGIEPEGLAAIDLLEGHPNFYRRFKWWTNGEKRAWVYMLAPKWLDNMKVYLTNDRTIHEGIWKPSDTETEYWETAA